jgi:hypothetical protein
VAGIAHRRGRARIDGVNVALLDELNVAKGQAAAVSLGPRSREAPGAAAPASPTSTDEMIRWATA